jgi:fatty-acyl-CoA synthase
VVDGGLVPALTPCGDSTLQASRVRRAPSRPIGRSRVQAQMIMREVTIAYRMTETSPVSTQSSVDDPLVKRVSTVGRV